MRAESYSFIVLEARKPRSRCQRAMPPLKAVVKNPPSPFPDSGSGPQSLVALSLWLHHQIPASVVTWPLPSMSVSLCPDVSLLIRKLVIGLNSKLFQYNLNWTWICLQRFYFSMSSYCTGTRIQDINWGKSQFNLQHLVICLVWVPDFRVMIYSEKTDEVWYINNIFKPVTNFILWKLCISICQMIAC